MKPGERLFPTWIPVLGLFSCLALAATLQVETILTGLGLLVAGFILRWLLKVRTGGSRKKR